jgi:transcriptional regulator with PAS, ATPase and Fis domain
LKDRKEDIPLLVDHFLQRKQKSKQTKRLSDDALQALLRYNWPGNIRELQHAIEGAMLMAHGDEITAADFMLSQTNVLQDAPSLPNDSSMMTIEDLEKIHIDHALKKFKYNRGKTAKALGITVKTLYLKIKRYKIPTPTED